MDILGGKGIIRGPSNLLGVAYRHAPIAITVEGANILTRALIIFGQGAVRCHPQVLAEMDGGARRRTPRRWAGRCWRMARHVLRNLRRSLVGAARARPAAAGAARRGAAHRPRCRRSSR